MEEKGSLDDILDDLKDLLYVLEVVPAEKDPIIFFANILVKYECVSPMRLVDLVHTKCKNFLRKMVRQRKYFNEIF